LGLQSHHGKPPFQPHFQSHFQSHFRPLFRPILVPFSVPFSASFRPSFLAILIVYSVESAHALLKRYIHSSQGDLLTTWLSIEQAVANQIQNIKADTAKERIRTPLYLDRRQYHACSGHITATALRLVQNHYDQAIKAKKPSEPLGPCTGVFNTTIGLPCAHQVKDIRNRGVSLLPEHFHKHWYWDRYLDLPVPTLEPLRTVS
jgi:hypothetical protein